MTLPDLVLLALEIVGVHGLVAGAIAFATVWLWRWAPAGLAERWAAAAGVALAYWAGTLVLHRGAELWPERHWQWLPYLALAAAVIGPASVASGMWMVERWLLMALVAVASAGVLVPAWPDLYPPRPLSIALLAAYLGVTMALLEALPGRMQGSLLVALLTIVSIAATGLVVDVSTKFAQLAMTAALALAGVWTAYFFGGTPTAAGVRGLVPVFTVLVGGLAYIGCVEPAPPLLGLLLVAPAPLALWACAAGPLGVWRGPRAMVAQAIAVALPLVLAVAWAQWRQS